MTSHSSPTPAARALKGAVALFWCWNVVFICATLPLLLAVPMLLEAWWWYDVPADYVFILLAWLAVPWACISLAGTRLKERPQALVFLFFAVEAPFFSLCLYRLVAMREITPAVGQWLAMMAFGLCVHGVDFLVRPLPKTAPWQTLKLMASACVVLVATYACALTLIAWSPLALRGLWEVIQPAHWLQALKLVLENPFLLIFMLLGAILVLLTGVSLLAMPWCMALLCARALRRSWEDGPLPSGRCAAVVAAMLVLQGAVGVVLNRQPQQGTFAQMEVAHVTPAQFEAKQGAWRAGLLNAYLSPYRYVSSQAESMGIAKAYQDLLGWGAPLAATPQALFNFFAKPLLYDGDMAADTRRAAELYERYFDSPIQRGERTAIARALSATHDSDERESGLINIDQRKVWVAEQRVGVQAQGDLARVTLDETYVNLTTEQQEIFYLFSLPEGAAVTGLWLGTSPDKMLPHTLATRGAAQRVYKAEVNRRIDPALLEQVGPRQYRLRAFPVPPRKGRPRAGQNPAAAETEPRLYLRLQYAVLARHGAWPLPVLAEKRNVAFDRHTRRSCDGGACPGDGSGWWPPELPARQPISPASHAFRLEGGPTVTAQPAAAAVPAEQGRKVTLVVDRSRSMAAHRGALLAAVQAARQQLAGNTVSVLLTTTAVMGEAPRLVPLDSLADSDLGVFMGGGHVDELLKQAAEHAPPGQDLTLVLTDDGAFDLAAGKGRPAVAGLGMLSFVHLGGALAPAYDDATLQAVQSGGGSSFTTLPEAWAHFARMQSAAPGFLMQRDGYAFSLSDQAGAVPDDAAFAPIAARLFIANAARGAQPLGMARLDALHALAKRHDVVTPYSSMLVLVDTAQQEDLARAEAGDDRFDRAHEQGVEVLQKPHNPLSASVTPEPEEWLLLLVSLCAAGWMIRARRRSAAVGGAPAGAAY
jgi:putative PEP-CTERM system integral membrane protein